MFERYTEQARRCIFFARYEAASFGSEHIESEHLLLGILREDKGLAGRVPARRIRDQVEQRSPVRERVSTSVDLPFSQESKTALSYAKEEADSFHHRGIDSGHLLLGLLRVETCLAAELLRENGVRRDILRTLVSQDAGARYPASGVDPDLEPPFDSFDCAEAALELEESAEKSVSPALESAVKSLIRLVTRASEHLRTLSDADAGRPMAKKTWSRKEALGHLIDYAAAHYNWVARALAEPKIAVAGYPQEEWVRSLGYQSLPWRDLVRAWITLNRLLAPALARVPEEKSSTPCRIGIHEAIPLSQLVAAYLEHCEDVLGQILARN